MIKTITKGLKALLIILLFGIVLASCNPFFDVGGNVTGGIDGNGGGQTLPPKTDVYKEVTAYDWMDLVDYLQSDETSYEIFLEMDTANIYLKRNILIVKPMKITGRPGTMYKIHSANSAARTAYYCLDLQADLELQNCGFVGYAGTSEASSGIMAGSPPINIRPGKTLTMTGRDSVLELWDVGGWTVPRTGSQLKLADNASLVDYTETGDLLFRAGVEKLTVNEDVSVRNKLTVGSGAILQIERGGELRVGSGATLTLDSSLKELKLDGNIVVDRTGGTVGNLVLAGSLDSLLTKITGGNGSLSVENGIPEETTKPFVFGANTRIKFNSNGVSLEKMISTDLPAVVAIDTNANITIPKGKKLVVGAGVILNVKNELTLKGGILEVAGNVNVTAGKMELSAEDIFNATPKGVVEIKNNGFMTIDIDNGGKFIDGYLEFTQSTPSGEASSITIESGSAFTLSGDVTLNVRVDAGLTGTFTVAGGAVLTVTGGNTLTVGAPNRLIGAVTNPPVLAPQLKIISGTVVISPLELDGDYEWSGNPPDWRQP